jgi:hypothetical protein
MKSRPLADLMLGYDLVVSEKQNLHLLLSFFLQFQMTRRRRSLVAAGAAPPAACSKQESSSLK